MNLQKLFNETVTSIEKIEEGFSVDEKFLVNGKYIVRILSLNRVERFKKVYDFQKKFHEVALCQKPINLIVDEQFGYYITEYLPGKNGLEVISSYSEGKQRELGIITGCELSKIHKKYVVEEYDVKSYLDDYLESKSQIAIESKLEEDLPEIFEVIEVVRKNIHHLYHLKGILTHSDYHLFNMIFDFGVYKGVIDFERCRTGIFLTDFRNNTPHNSDVSPAFASGFIDGYLDEIPVDNFFLMYNIHDLLVTIAALTWVKQFNPENVEVDIVKIQKIFKQKDKLDQAPPWYIGKY